MKIDIQAVIELQLNQFYAAIAQEKENRVKVRNWQITVLIAFIAYLSSNNISDENASRSFSMALLFGIVSIFWVIEAFYQSLVLALLKRVSKLELLLANRTGVPLRISKDLFFESGFDTVTSKEKLIFFSRACIRCKSIVFFNVALMIGVFILSLMLF